MKALPFFLTALLFIPACAGCPPVADDDVCGAMQVRCGDLCVSLRNSVDHCGFCGVACADGDSCVDGLCFSSCESPSLPSAAEDVLLEDPRLDVVATGRAADGRVIAVLRDGGLLDASTTPPTLSPPGTSVGTVVDVQDVDPAPGDELVVFRDNTLRVVALDGTPLFDTGLTSGAFNDVDGDGRYELVNEDGLWTRGDAGFVLTDRAPPNPPVSHCVASFDVDEDGVAEIVGFGFTEWWRAEGDAWVRQPWAGGNIGAPCERVIEVHDDHVTYVGERAVFDVVRREGTLALEARQRFLLSSIEGAFVRPQFTSFRQMSWIEAGRVIGSADGTIVGAPQQDRVLVVDDEGRLLRRPLLVLQPLVIVIDDVEHRFDQHDVIIDGAVVERGSRVLGEVALFAGLPVAAHPRGPLVIGADLFDATARPFVLTPALQPLPGAAPGTMPGAGSVVDVDGDGAAEVLFARVGGFTEIFADDGLRVVDGFVVACDFGDGDATFVGKVGDAAGVGHLDGDAFVIDEPLPPSSVGFPACRDLDGDGDVDLQGVRNDDGDLVVDEEFVGGTDLDGDGVLERVDCGEDDDGPCALVDDDLRLPLPPQTVSVRTGVGQTLYVGGFVGATVLPLSCGD